VHHVTVTVHAGHCYVNYFDEVKEKDLIEQNLGPN